MNARAGFSFLPLLFIVLWSTGYIVGKIGVPYAGPFTLLALRFGLSSLVLLPIALLMRAPWPRRASAWGHLAVTGLLFQGLQFAGLYYALKHGLSASVSALIIGMMPLLTALGAQQWLGEHVSKRQWLGLFGGLIGVALVVLQREGVAGDQAGWDAYVAVTLGLLGIAAGTLYQKRFCSNMDMRSGSFIQAICAALAMLLLGWSLEGLSAEWTGELVFATLWLALVNSIAGFTLLFIMVQHGQASQVASLFFLIPGVSAVMGYAVLGERLSAMAWLGFTISALAVYVCTRSES